MKQIFIVSATIVFIFLLFFYVNKNSDNTNSTDVTSVVDEVVVSDEDKISIPSGGAIVKNNKESSKDRVLLAVKKYVANNFNVAETSIVVDSIHGEDWPDGCLGLPKSDEACTEMIVFGYEVELKFLGQERKFRTNQDGSVIREDVD